MLPRRHVGPAICLMVVASLAHGLSRGQLPAWPAGVLAWLIGTRLIIDVTRFQQVQAGLMAAVGCAALAAAWLLAGNAPLLRLVEGNQALLAMFATVSFLRTVTRTGAQPGERLPEGRLAVVQTLFATHVLGAIVNISSLYIIGHRIARGRELTALQAKVITRGFVAAGCWSPMFASMAVVLHYVPGTDMLAVSRINLMLALALLTWSAVTLMRDTDAPGFTGFPLHREALTVPVVLSLLMLVLYPAPTGWTILTIIKVAAAACVALLCCTRPPVETVRRLRHHVEHELPRMGGEFALFLGAAVLAAGISAIVPVLGIDFAVDPRRAMDCIPLLFTLVALTLLGIHPVISTATLSGLFPQPLGNPDLVAMTILMAWALALGTSPFGGTTLFMQGRFGIRATRFVRWNAPYTAAGLVFATLILIGLDAVR